ncbi:hypothetical protein P4U99_06895 [Brevibacillus agri]|uniref:hypothetical protein n=1 Tax=Brevibacillus agri TaxID=51101 RepID=UPI0028680892|nr:hypothetical protein [Brevibacillus agri]MED1642913.1 hypothetical protein [Brevibacillus agri]MED1652653.1 hypothetical protein [Brevibacillus agri]MED1688347.1 hypothetical protein [Brevibacillus agri]MED1692301.1 hypothetical protein [Brevibacillus agri]MED1698845.1 hypothetical protein [Brevibacillus agri]
MDVEKGLRQLATVERQAWKLDDERKARMEQNILTQAKRRKSALPRIGGAVAAGIVLAVTVGVGLQVGVSNQGGKHPLEAPYGEAVLSQRAAQLIEIMALYGGVHAAKISASPLAGVFAEAQEGVLLEEPYRKVHILFFPEGYRADQIKIVEDFTRPKEVTYTFQGAKLREDLLPLSASGPTYLYAVKNVLFLTSSLSLHADVKFALDREQRHEQFLQGFGLSPSAYAYLHDYKQNAIYTDMGWKQDALKQIRLLSRQPMVERGTAYKGSIPAVFLKKDEPVAVVIYNDGLGSNHLAKYRWDEQAQKWELEEKKSMPATGPAATAT